MMLGRPRTWVAGLLLLALAGATGSPALAQSAAKPSTATSTGSSSSTFSREQLDQMMAPIALYPDSLLSQVLMASTYPGDVADAVKWSKAHPDAKGETAVKQVANQPWDPSVQSLVAFPQLLAVLGQDPSWVQKMGDAFLADPNSVMDSVQRLRRQADAAGNLKSNKEQTVKKESAPPPGTTTTVVQQPAQQTIVIEPTDPEVVYVPSYNPSVVYGSWAYPSYPPYYYPPPAYYYPGAALFSFGVGVAVGGALWGNCNWWGGDVDIDVNRYNNINSNRQISRTDNKWQHNAANRDGVPYRDNASREKFGRQLDGAGQRDSFRGRDGARDGARTADRDRARQSMEQRGFQTPATSNREARDRAGQASREQAARGQGRGGDMQRPSNAQTRDMSRERNAASQRQGNNAFAGSRDAGQSRAASNRGNGSFSSSQRPSSSRGGGHSMQRPARAPMRGGGGRRR